MHNEQCNIDTGDGKIGDNCLAVNYSRPTRVVADDCQMVDDDIEPHC